MARAGGSMLRKGLASVLRGRALYGSPQVPNLIWSRGMSSASSRLFVGGLAFSTEEEGLRTAFSKFGEVIDARIVTDRESGRSRGFGFITFLTEAEAETAMNKMDKQFLDGRVIRVNPATPRPAPPPRPMMDNYGSSSQQPQEPASQDWGSIPSPMAAVPQNAGGSGCYSMPAAGTSPTSSSFDSPASGLPDLSTLASPGNSFMSNSSFGSASSSGPSSFGGSFGGGASGPSSFGGGFGGGAAADISTPTKASTKDTGPSFDFIDLDLSNLPPPDPNRLPRRRPPRIRPSSMVDYEFGYYMSETSKFPFNTNFDTGFPRSKTPEFEFDFTDIKEVLAIKKAEQLVAKQAKDAEELALKQAQEAVAAQQSQETEAVAGALLNQTEGAVELEQSGVQLADGNAQLAAQDALSPQSSTEVQPTVSTVSTSQVQQASYGS